MPALYRVRQFARAAAALVWPVPGNEEVATRYLSPAALSLFRAMPRYDRRHALAVTHALVRQGHDNPHLIAAALLHDAGKTCSPHGRVALLHRVWVVLGRRFAPALLEWLGRDPAPGARVPRWRRPFYTQRHHPALGARLALDAGCSNETAALIAHHEERKDVDPLLCALQAADSVN